MPDRPRIDELPEVVKLRRKIVAYEEALRQARDAINRVLPKRRAAGYDDPDEIARAFRDEQRQDREATASRRNRQGIPLQASRRRAGNRG